MANTDAWRAPAAPIPGRRSAGRNAGPRGNARVIAEPAYRRLLAAEPLLKRSIPTLIVIFLVVVAAVRFLSLVNWHDEIERNAKAMLALAAGELVNAVMLLDEDSIGTQAASSEILQRTVEHGAMGSRFQLAITDGNFKVVAASTRAMPWLGKALDELVSSGQPLFMFGERAGVMEVVIDGHDYYAAVDITDKRTGAVAALIAQDEVFYDWRRMVSLNVTLYVLTASILLIILYAYFSQAARAQAADRIYLEAHQRIDLALARGRCGLWDWDMVRGKMYWSRSMYDMLGYQSCDRMLSFGEVADIIHAEDGDLFDLANKIVSREIDLIDQVFRMRHASGQWVWMRVRAHVIDPDAAEIQLIGIAVDVTEQRNLAMRSEAADMRLRTAIENTSESFVLWDAADRLVMCNSKFQQDHGLSDRDLAPGTPRETIEKADDGVCFGAAAGQCQRPARRHLRTAIGGRTLATGERVEDARRRHGLGRQRHHPAEAAPGEAGRQRKAADGDHPRPQPGSPRRRGTRQRAHRHQQEIHARDRACGGRQPRQIRIPGQYVA